MLPCGTPYVISLVLDEVSQEKMCCFLSVTIFPVIHHAQPTRSLDDEFIITFIT